jgi:hypothetical protein
LGVVYDHEKDLDERAGVFEPDTMLPSQWLDRRRGRGADSGERRLMAAVLEDAVRVYLKHAGNRDASRLEAFREVEEWFASPDSTWFYSFENVCSVLDIHPGYVRRGLRRWTTRAERPSEPVAPPREPIIRRAS